MYGWVPVPHHGNTDNCMYRIDTVICGRTLTQHTHTHSHTKQDETRRRLIDCVREDLREKWLSEVDVYDQAGWRRAVRNIDLTKKGKRCTERNLWEIS